MQINLRPYQIKSIAALDDAFRKGNRNVILWAMTGAGKTTISAWMIQRSVKYNHPVMFVVRGRELVKNISDTLDRYGIDHSVNMAGHWRYDSRKIVQLASIDTLKSKKNYPFLDKTPLIFLDESHKNYDDIFEKYKNAFIIGMTATPFTDNSNYHSYVNVIEGYELRDQGFLVPEKIYCPHIINVSGVKMRAGDFDKKQLHSVVTQSAIVGNIVQDYIELGQNRPTICFATSVEHSLQLKQAFCDAGIPAIHCDASSSDEERKGARADIESGKIKILCNVDIYSTGFDCPIISCIILARPTFSLTWNMQALGRGLRPYPGKKDCIILDNAGNVFRNGTPYRVREISLEKPQKRKSKAYETKVTTCMKCYFVYDPTQSDSCPECGEERDKKERRVNHIDGKLIEFEESPSELAKRRRSMIVQKYYELEWARKKNKLRHDWSFIQLFKSYSREEMEHLKTVTVVPDRFLPFKTNDILHLEDLQG